MQQRTKPQFNKMFSAFDVKNQRVSMATHSASLFAKKHSENRRKSEHLGLSQVSENFDEGLALLKPTA